MVRISTYRKIKVITAFVVLNAFPVVAQSTGRVDSLIARYTSDIYKNPESVIRICDSVYNSPESTNADKAKVLMLMSDSYSSKRDYQKSWKCFLNANALSKKTNDVEFQISLLSKSAVKYQQFKMYDKALKCLEECDRLIAAHPLPKGRRDVEPINYIVKGFIYKEQLNCNIAIEYFNKGISEYKKTNSITEQPNLSIANYNKGNCYILLSDYKAAKNSFREAIGNAESVNAKSLKAFAQKGLAEVYALEGDYEKAISMLKEALTNSKEVGDLVLNYGIYTALANNYLAINNLQEYTYYNQFVLKNQYLIVESERRSSSDSIEELNTTNSEKLDKMETQYLIVILLQSLLVLFLAYVLFSYLKRSSKSMEILNLEVKRIKDNLKKEVLN
jgi:tetratricopeptide (TPR) repeat protein